MNKHRLKALTTVGVIFIALFGAGGLTAGANDTRQQGTDQSKFQGNSGKLGYNTDKFMIAQLGGSYGGTLINQATYSGQVKTANNHHLRAHTYVWYGIGGSMTNAKAMLKYYLPRIQTPKGSIVALDYEDGASGSVKANTDAIIYGMEQIKKAGYTPMLYSGKYYLQSHVDYNRVLKEFPVSFWIASYHDYSVMPKPNYHYFLSFPGVAIWQFTSMYRSGGLDGNVDLTGITSSGYGKTSPARSQAAKTNPHKVVKPSVKTVSDYAQKATFTPNRRVNVYNSMDSHSKVQAHYNAWEHVYYNHVYIRSDKTVWARYSAYNGSQRYICLGILGGTSYGSRVVW